MKNKLMCLLEENREASGEKIEVFAKRIFPESSGRSASSFYLQIRNGVRPFPEKCIGVIAGILGMDTLDVLKLNTKNSQYGKDPKFTSTDLCKMAEITEAAGKPLPISLLVRILNEAK